MTLLLGRRGEKNKKAAHTQGQDYLRADVLTRGEPPIALSRPPSSPSSTGGWTSSPGAHFFSSHFSSTISPIYCPAIAGINTWREEEEEGGAWLACSRHIILIFFFFFFYYYFLIWSTNRLKSAPDCFDLLPCVNAPFDPATHQHHHRHPDARLDFPPSCCFQVRGWERKKKKFCFCFFFFFFRFRSCFAPELKARLCHVWRWFGPVEYELIWSVSKLGFSQTFHPPPTLCQGESSNVWKKITNLKKIIR